jgi:CDP-paratose 2-epimerase
MINSLNFHEQETRFVLDKDQSTPGVSRDGITEHLPLDGPRTLYGATKLASEIVIQEYIAMYGLRVIINRCSVITGSWQFGKIDQGVVSFWLASHLWRKDLSFIGYGGKGKQVRDILHVDDLFDLLQIQISEIDRHNGVIYNVGGGENLSISLLELTKLVKEITGNTLEIGSVSADRPGDIRVFVTDTKKVFGATGWKPKRTIETILYEMCNWLIENETSVKSLL